MDEETQKQLFEIQANFERRNPYIEKLLKADPRLSEIAAIVIAGDMLSAEDRFEDMKSGKMDYEKARVFVGSYARLDFAVRAMEQGYTTIDDIFADLAELWRGSDPDDTDPRFLDLWQKAWVVNGNQTIRDGRPLPRTKLITVFRGQDEGAKFGIAWSTDPKIAAKFANGAATRQSNRGGVVYRAVVPRRRIIAYLTGRGESETIVNPADLTDIEVV